MIRTGKFNNKIVKTEDGTFHSLGEYKRWNILKLLVRAGEIADLQRQVKYSIDVNGVHICNYIADFVYVDLKKNCTIVEDFKGFRTRDFEIKSRLMRALHGIEIFETSAKKK